MTEKTLEERFAEIENDETCYPQCGPDCAQCSPDGFAWRQAEKKLEVALDEIDRLRSVIPPG